MKNLLLSLLFIGFTSSINAQNYTISSYIGDDDEYWSGAYVYDFLYPTNNLSSWYDLPFDWNFYGQPVTGYRIAHDGYITFDNSTGNSIGANTNIPDSGGPNNAIYACWDDFTDDVTISVKTFGATPNRVHVISWAGLNYPGAAAWSDDIGVDIKIYENCGDFEVVVFDRNIDSTSTYFPMINTTIGCENINGTVGIEIPGSPNYIPSNPNWSSSIYEVHRFTWNAPIVNNASLIGVRIDNHLTVGDHTLKGMVRNEGDALLGSYDINYSLDGGTVQTTTINEADTIWTGDYEVVISTIDWADEISWDVTNSGGSIMASGTGYADNNTYNIPLCVPAGSYTFNWYDSYGDGWNGCSYEVFDNNGVSLTSGVPTSGYSGNSNFTSAGSSCSWYIASTIKNSNKSEWTHPIDINISSASDNYELKVWVSNVNGQNDEMNCNDTLIEYITGIENVSANKKVIIEEWTGTWCGYCIDGAVVMDDLVSQHGGNLIPVVVHDGDPMEFLDSLRSSYTASGYPGALIDRTKPLSAGIYENEDYGRGSWDTRVSTQLSQFTPVNINIDHTWDTTTREIIANVTLDYIDNSAGDARIVLMILEDSLTGIGQDWDQANNYDGTLGHPYYGAGQSVVGFIHKHVLRDYVEGGCFGVDNVIPHIVSSGSTYQHQFTYTLPTSFDANQISLVAAVVKYIEGNDAQYVSVRGQRKIYNAESVHLMDWSPPPLGVDDNKTDLKIYPNPTHSMLYLSEKVEYTIYNILGDIVLVGNENIIDLSSLNTGIYIFESENMREKIIKE